MLVVLFVSWSYSSVTGFSSPMLPRGHLSLVRSPAQGLRTPRLPMELGYGEKLGIDPQLVFDTWEWTANLGAPGAFELCIKSVLFV